MRRRRAAWLDAGVTLARARLCWSGSGLLLLGLLALAGPSARAGTAGLVAPGRVGPAPAERPDEEGLLGSPALAGQVAAEREGEPLRTRRGAGPLFAPGAAPAPTPCLPCDRSATRRAPARPRPSVRPQLLPRAPPRA